MIIPNQRLMLPLVNPPKERSRRNDHFILPLAGQPGYSEDVLTLAKQTLVGTILAYQDEETVDFDALPYDINMLLFDDEGEIRLSPGTDRYYRLLNNQYDEINLLRQGTEYLVRHVLRENHDTLISMYDTFNIRDVDVPIVTKQRFIVNIYGVPTCPSPQPSFRLPR